MDRPSGGSGDRFQVRLWDLFVLVVGASYVLDVARRAKPAWGGGMPDFEHAVGLTVLSLGMVVGAVVLGQWVGRMKLREGRAWASTWRVMAVGWLAGALVEVAAALQVPTTGATGLIFGLPDTLRLRLSSLTAVLGMVGLILAVAPLGPRQIGPKPRPGRGSLPTVSLAVVVGLAVLTFGHGLLPYLVLLALEAVQNAMRLAPLVARPIVFDRLTTASLEALPGLIGCLLTAAWVDDDLRAGARDPLAARALRSWRGTIARTSTAILAAAGSAYVVLISFPKLSPPLWEGLLTVVEPSLVATVVLGFTVLAAGFAARAAGRLAAATSPDNHTAVRESLLKQLGPWPGWIFGGLAGLASLEIILAAVQEIRGDLEDRWYVPIRLEDWKLLLRTPAGWFGDDTGSSTLGRLIDRPEDFLIGIGGVWLVVRLVGMAYQRPPGGPSPLDLVADDRLALRRFFGWWAGLTTAIVASLPGLAIVSLTVFHFVTLWITN